MENYCLEINSTHCAIKWTDITNRLIEKYKYETEHRQDKTALYEELIGLEQLLIKLGYLDK